ncbi:MAG TPA: DUF4097 family beta strand repeat-containing protein [Gaiellaceae bacterium]|jgi:hypothetical protein|nr:DUF4097 family beta strand repeat-containing protein [Gaiellaceae bacterium]
MPAWTFDTPGPVGLDLELPLGRVELETVEGTTTHVDLEGSSEFEDIMAKAIVEAVQRGNGHQVRVEVRDRTGLIIRIGNAPTMRLRVSCPPEADVVVRTKSADVRARGSYGSFEAKTASGDVGLDRVNGDARLKTASGDVAIERAGGTVQVQTASGDVALQKARGDVAVQAVSGDVWLKDASRSVRVNTVSGDQRLEAVVEGAVQAESVSGDVLIGVRRGARVYVDAKTVSGSTSSELELTDAPAGHDAGADEGDGPMVEVRAKTVSGDIAIVRAAAAPSETPAS